MRLLRINDQDVDLDDKTAIGITFQAYDFKEPGKRKFTLSNSFSIPLTANNQKIIGFANNVQFTDLSIYSPMTCDYWNDNEHLIINSNVRIEEVSNRIKLYVVNKDTFWDELRNFKWGDFLAEYEDWLIDQGEYFTGTTPNYFTGTISQFISNQLSGSRVLIPFYLSNYFQYEPGGEGTGFLENENTMYVTYDGKSGGHLCTYIKSIFEFIEFKYGVDFLTLDTDPTLLWNDTYAPNIYIPLRHFTLATNGTGWAWSRFYTKGFLPYEDLFAYESKSLFDLIAAYFQLFNVIIDESDISGTKTIKLRRFDDIETLADVVNFSGKLDLSKVSFKPKLADYQQNNLIKYSEVYPGAENDEVGAKTIVCKNENLDTKKELFTIDAYYPDVLAATYGDSIVNLSTEESFKTYPFMISNGIPNHIISIYVGTTNTNNTFPELAQIYGISGEYNFIDTIAEYPKSYTVNKWLSIPDVIDLEYFKQYYIRELNGSFFINKISGFNPDKSNKPTKIELVYVSDKAPKEVIGAEYYVDGLGNPFVDGLGNNWGW